MYPIIDLHCDLLLYLSTAPNASIHATEDIGVTLPYLKSGNVKLQVMAIFTPSGNGSAELGKMQLDCYKKLLEENDFYSFTNKEHLQEFLTNDKIGIIPAIENANAICDDNEPLDNCFQRLDDILKTCNRLCYITMTHHPENRFGGGNYSDNIGLKEDGKVLLEYMSEHNITIDLSHTSDQLAIDILDYIEAKSLKNPVIASHSNFRSLWNHPRNLPDEYVQRIVEHQGLIGMNFLRAFVHDTDSEYLLKHIEHGLQPEIALDQLVFGADFFYRPGLTDRFPERIPLFFPEHMDAGKYPSILDSLRKRGVDEFLLEKLSYKNALDFFNRTWS